MISDPSSSLIARLIAAAFVVGAIDRARQLDEPGVERLRCLLAPDGVLDVPQRRFTAASSAAQRGEAGRRLRQLRQHGAQQREFVRGVRLRRRRAQPFRP